MRLLLPSTPWSCVQLGSEARSIHNLGVFPSMRRNGENRGEADFLPGPSHRQHRSVFEGCSDAGGFRPAWGRMIRRVHQIDDFVVDNTNSVFLGFRRFQGNRSGSATHEDAPSHPDDRTPGNLQCDRPRLLRDHVHVVEDSPSAREFPDPRTSAQGYPCPQAFLGFGAYISNFVHRVAHNVDRMG